MQECLRVIARELAPDEKQLQGKIKQADLNSGAVKKRGLNILVSRWDKGPQYALACLAVNENVAAANAHIIRWCREYRISKDSPQEAGDVDPRKILRAALLPETRARLTAEALAAIEDAAYAFVFRRSVIDPAAPPWNNARRSVWLLSGSENHDANQKMALLLALQFLCLHGQRHDGGTPLADGRPVREHYTAWRDYWKEYTRQRVREGLFAEVAQPGSYGRATISAYLDLHDLAEDPVLRRLGGDMATLHFAQLATEFEPRTGTRGRSPSRVPRTPWTNNSVCIGPRTSPTPGAGTTRPTKRFSKASPRSSPPATVRRLSSPPSLAGRVCRPICPPCDVLAWAATNRRASSKCSLRTATPTTRICAAQAG